MSQLYRWKSEVLRDYYPGTIIVVGASVDEARRIARERFQAYYQDGIFREESAQEVFAMFEKDIEAEPVVDDYVFIHGG